MLHYPRCLRKVPSKPAVRREGGTELLEKDGLIDLSYFNVIVAIGFFARSVFLSQRHCGTRFSTLD